MLNKNAPSTTPPPGATTGGPEAGPAAARIVAGPGGGSQPGPPPAPPGEIWALVADATNESAWEWDIATGWVRHDERWARLLGCRPDELLQSLHGWRERVHPDDLAAGDAIVRAHFEGRTPYYEHELRLRTGNGDWRWIFERGRVVRRDPQGRPLRVVGTHSDLTGRKDLGHRLRQAETLAREFSLLARLGGWEIDVPARKVTWTEGTREIHEVDAGFEPTLENISRFLPPDAVMTLPEILHSTTPDAPLFDVEVPLLTARGRRLRVRLRGRVGFSDARPVFARGVIQDLTALHESEQARRALEARLLSIQKVDTSGTLAGGIAHDFNNLLTGIIGFHELATDSLPADHPARMCLNEAHQAALRARELVAQILAIDGPAEELAPFPPDPGPVREETQRLPAPAEASQEPPGPASAPPPQGSGELIYLVDDEEAVGRCTRLLLESKGYRTMTFDSAETCLAQFTGGRGDCALLMTDLTMPGMPGTELAAAVRRLNPGLPVVILSGLHSPIPPEALAALGRFELLSKPFTTDELGRAVHRALLGAHPSSPAGA